MAIAQGICKNCGSMVVYNTGDDTCECIFCNAVFPMSELIPIDAELKDIVFPNEKFEKRSNSTKTSYSMMPDQVSVEVERAKKHEALSPEAQNKTNEFEISAKDVKAPKKLVIMIAAATAAFVLIVVAISLPLYFMRTGLLKSVEERMGDVTKDVVKVDTSKDADGRNVGFSLEGLNSQIVGIVTEDQASEEKAKQLFDNYCKVRGEIKEGLDSSDVKMTLYAKEGIYQVTADGVEFVEDSKPLA